jgi:hypothetical protein
MRDHHDVTHEEVAPVHDRMPVILTEDNEAAWLNPDEAESEALLAMLRPAPDETKNCLGSCDMRCANLYFKGFSWRQITTTQTKLVSDYVAPSRLSLGMITNRFDSSEPREETTTSQAKLVSCPTQRAQ